MRDRLASLLSEAEGLVNNDLPTVEQIADYLIEHGVIVPPCKAGDTIYLPWEWKDTSGVAILTVERVSITEAVCSIWTDLRSDDEDYWFVYDCGVFKFDDIGKTVFLTREEAEKALAERSAE